MGGLRATAQMISYEIALGISLVGVIVVYGTIDLAEIVRAQGQLIGGLVSPSGIIKQPQAFFFFITSALSPKEPIALYLPRRPTESNRSLVAVSLMETCNVNF